MMSKAAKTKEIKTRAWNNFSLGWNCPECVIEAVLAVIDTGLPKDTLKNPIAGSAAKKRVLRLPVRCISREKISACVRGWIRRLSNIIRMKKPKQERRQRLVNNSSRA
ncbi:MAG: hypothetical protein OER74_20580 [Desulfobacteraceae bacterium]|nr:hypothetical protein [Desulfobacteraceae bacterium]